MKANELKFMREALDFARKSALAGEVPVGALVVCQGEIIGSAHNQPITRRSACAHAEMLAIEAACQRQGNYRLNNCDLYVTLEPCVMCLGAIFHARIKHLVFGAKDPKTGAVCSQAQLVDNKTLNHHLTWTGGVLADESRDLLQTFFRDKRG